jgi:hypothetical protein
MQFRNPTKSEFEALQALADAGELCWLDSAGELADSFDEINADLAMLEAAVTIGPNHPTKEALANINAMASELYRQAHNEYLAQQLADFAA